MRKRDIEKETRDLRFYIENAKLCGPRNWKREFACYIWDQRRTAEYSGFMMEKYKPHINDRWCLQVGTGPGWAKLSFPTKEAAQAKAVELVLLDLAGRIHYRRPR